MSSKILSQNNLGVPDGSSNKVATPKAPATSASEFSTFKDFSSYQRIELPNQKPIGMSSHKISSITSNTGRLFSQDMTNPFNQAISKNERQESNLEQMILVNILKEEINRDSFSKNSARPKKSLSIDRFNGLKKGVEKHKLVDAILNILETKMQRTQTANFRSSLAN